VRRSRLARGRRELLVQWKGQPAAEATWTDLEEFQKLYPEFQLEDELLAAGGMSWSVCSSQEGVPEAERGRTQRQRQLIRARGGIQLEYPVSLLGVVIHKLSGYSVVNLGPFAAYKQGC
jgi:hypothetical protein